MARGIFGGLKGVDAFGKTMEDVKVKTRTGAFLTILSAAIILAFSTIEFLDYRRVNMDTSIVVDRSRGERLTVNMNVSFPKVPCYLLSLDVMDISGEAQRDLSHNIIKTRLDPSGAVIPNSHSAELRNKIDVMSEHKVDEGYCGSCYGGLEPESGCCNTCDEVRQAYVNKGWSFTNPDAIEQCMREGWSEHLKEQAAEGCNIAGKIRVNKVIGNLHLSPGRSYQTNYMNMHELVPYLRDGHQHDFGHTIYELSFEGDDEYDFNKAERSRQMKKKLGISENPLDGTVMKAGSPQYMFQYFLKVVSTRFETLDGQTVNTHQYSATHFERDLTTGAAGQTAEGVKISHMNSGSPGMFVNYEISPLLVVHSESRQAFAHFLTSTCAIVGGVLTIATIVDSVVFATGRRLKKSGNSGPVAGSGYGSGKLM